MISRVLRSVDVVVRILKGALDAAISASMAFLTRHKACAKSIANSRESTLVSSLSEAGVVGAGVLTLRLDGAYVDCMFQSIMSITFEKSVGFPSGKQDSRYVSTNLYKKSVRSGSTKSWMIPTDSLVPFLTHAVLL